MFLILGVLYLFIWVGSGEATASQEEGQPDELARSKFQISYAMLPMSFEVNQGQVDGDVKYIARGKGYTLFLASDEAILSLQKTGHIQKKYPTLLPPISVNDDPGDASQKEGGLSFPFKPKGNTLGSSRKEDTRVHITNAVLRMRLVGVNKNQKVVGRNELL